jgi:hypothetical protein
MKEPKYNEKWIVKAIDLYLSGKGPSEIWYLTGKPGKKKSFSSRIYHWMHKAGLPTRGETRKIDWEKIRNEVNPQKEDYP